MLCFLASTLELAWLRRDNPASAHARAACHLVRSRRAPQQVLPKDWRSLCASSSPNVTSTFQAFPVPRTSCRAGLQRGALLHARENSATVSHEPFTHDLNPSLDQSPHAKQACSAARCCGLSSAASAASSPGCAAANARSCSRTYAGRSSVHSGSSACSRSCLHQTHFHLSEGGTRLIILLRAKHTWQGKARVRAMQSRYGVQHCSTNVSLSLPPTSCSQDRHNQGHWLYTADAAPPWQPFSPTPQGLEQQLRTAPVRVQAAPLAAAHGRHLRQRGVCFTQVQ